MGTPDFAVPSLEAIMRAGYTIVGVITAPDRPSGRGRKLNFSPVKTFAVNHNLPLFQPTNLRDSEFVSEINNLKPDLQIVVAFRMLPEVIWSIPRMGTFNLHASLLPQYRGAAPINHAIINGESVTGLTTFFIDEKIDTGKVLDQMRIEISNDDTFGDLHDKMMHEGANLILTTIQKIVESNIEAIDQSNMTEASGELMKAPKLSKEFCRINWDEEVETIYNFIRGLSPYPAAYSFLVNDSGDHLSIKVFKAEKISETHSGKTGQVVSDNKSYLKVAARDGFINITEMQAMGKRRMSIREFLNGFDVSADAHFSK